MQFNKVLLGGNLTRDPELSYLPSQTAVVNFGIATNRKWTKDGQQQEEVCFIDCVAFGKTAENINKYFSKGSPIFVEGGLKFETWTGQDEAKHSKHKVNIFNFQFIGSKEGKPVAERQSGAEHIADEPDGIPF